VPELRASAIAVAELPGPAMLRRMSARRREEYVSLVEGTASDWPGRLEAQLEAHGVRPKTRMLRGRPAKVMADAAGRYQVVLGVLGSRGSRRKWGPRRGRTALGVAGNSRCSWLVVGSPGRGRGT